ncbi:MAG: preprotein translocase subunit SecG [Bacteroidetes bacterium]|nr:MAG: preprotein translocase subunit SecG [Bacteroidota bacterium]
MNAIFSIIIILASILLVLVVFIQNPKGGGLSTDFGAAHQLGGVQKTNDFIEKTTWSLAGIILVLSITLTIRTSPEKPKVQEAQQTQQTTPGQSQPAR